MHLFQVSVTVLREGGNVSVQKRINKFRADDNGLNQLGEVNSCDIVLEIN